MAAGDPTGDDLCSGTTDGDTLPEAPAAPEEREIDFGVGVELTEGVKYAIVVKAPDAGNWYDCNWSLQFTGSYANGDYRGSDDNGVSWTAASTNDLWFKTYAGAVLKDSHTFDHAGIGAGVGINILASQSFTATSTYTITSIKLNLYRQAGESPGTITISIKATVGAPGKPTLVSPTPTGITGVTLDETPLEWAAGDPAGDTYDVYFRVQGEEWVEVSSAQEALLWAITFGTLGYGTTYEWRVDATNEEGTTTGDTWSFTCLAFAPPLPTGVTLDADGEPTGTPTGENTMLTVKRLVAAAENAFYYEDI
jgi:hypothetical protein